MTNIKNILKCSRICRHTHQWVWSNFGKVKAPLLLSLLLTDSVFKLHSCPWSNLNWSASESGKRDKNNAYPCVCTCISWIWGSVYVWMLDQARWWSGWLVLAELISQFPGWRELNGNRLSCCFPDQAGCFLMRQADRELSHWRGRLTHENETTIHMLGSRRKTRREREGEGVKRGK